MRDTNWANGKKLWLASYPRSGNTYLRIILHEVFGLESTSIYVGEDLQFASKGSMIRRIGHVEDPSATSSIVPIKTHQKPSDTEKAIFCIRDGRACLASYYHYLKDIARTPASMEEVIRGEAWPGFSWTDHYRAWSPLQRPDTLFLRYEELVGDIFSVIDKIQNFIQIQPRTHDISSRFEIMHEIYPEFFSVGSDKIRIAELDDHIGLFNSIHADVMRELGFYPL